MKRVVDKAVNPKPIKSIIIRYALIFLLSLGGLYLFYKIFTPLTLYPAYFALNRLFDATLHSGSLIFFKSYFIELIPACIAGAAYFLLTALNLTTPMSLKTRVKSLSFILLSFLVLNILRIVIFASLALSGFQYFDLAHKLSWYFGSTFLVVAIWLINIRIFKIKAIPVYSDAKAVISLIEKKKK